MRIAPVAICVALLAAANSGLAAAIVRCEGPDGRVTYSNNECPPNTKAVRQVDLAPPVVVHDGAPAPKDSRPPPARQEPARD